MPVKTKVLIIDDDPAICDSVKAILEGNGYEVAAALSGRDGVERFRTLRPDIVLCDMMMEDVDSGAKAAKIMRDERPGVPLFLLSTIGDAAAVTVGAAELGFNGVFQKPVDFDRLLAVLAMHVRPSK
jgi:CheY-like chemotaxis protein